MKIITWNCNMAFRKKASLVLDYKPDILVIPECEHPDKILSWTDTVKPKDALWFGKNLHKGIGIFSYTNYRFSLHENYDHSLRHVIPISVKGPGLEFNLFAIWANNPEDPDGQYVEQVWKAI
ncbi:MAG TPA: hypothetical protein VFV08_09105, partial [Puia sp.]|nr:hypothetical protein [Puia sp.]